MTESATRQVHFEVSPSNGPAAESGTSGATSQVSQSSSATSPSSKPLVTTTALYRTLRAQELSAYSHVIRAFVAQGLTLDSSRLRMLADLRGMLHVSDTRHSLELAAAQNDSRLAQVVSQKIHKRRLLFKDPTQQPVFLEDRGSETDDLPEDTKIPSLAASAGKPGTAGDTGKRKRGRAEALAPPAQSSPPPFVPTPPAAPMPTSIGGPQKWTLAELQQKIESIRKDIGELHTKIARATTSKAKDIYQKQVDEKARELTEIMSYLDYLEEGDEEEGESVEEEVVQGDHLNIDIVGNRGEQEQQAIMQQILGPA